MFEHTVSLLSNFLQYMCLNVCFQVKLSSLSTFNVTSFSQKLRIIQKSNDLSQ